MIRKLDNKLRILAGVLVAYLFVGALAGVVMSPMTMTQMACPCDIQQAISNSSQNERIGCNSVQGTNYIFFTGVIDIYQNKEGQQVILCENGSRTGQKIVYDEVSPYYVSILGNEYSF